MIGLWLCVSICKQKEKKSDNKEGELQVCIQHIRVPIGADYFSFSFVCKCEGESYQQIGPFMLIINPLGLGDV